jgi:hypothetical protein
MQKSGAYGNGRYSSMIYLHNTFSQALITAVNVIDSCNDDEELKCLPSVTDC